MEVVRQRKQDMVQGLLEMHEGRFEQSDADLIIGNGRFVDPTVIAVETADETSRKIRRRYCDYQHWLVGSHQSCPRAYRSGATDTSGHP